MSTNIAAAIAQYVTTLQAAHNDANTLVVAEAGKKFVKIIVSRAECHGAHRHVHAFVDMKTGALYKPAGWKGPVRDERYNLVTDMQLVKQVIDPYGSYLYADAATHHRKVWNAQG